MQIDMEVCRRELAAQKYAYPSAPFPVYPGGRKRELTALLFAYRAHLMTPREFSLRMQWLMRGGR
jgi:hypothetical protein